MKILIPVDGSKISKKIVERAKDIGEKNSAKLILLHVMNEANLPKEYHSQALYDFEIQKSKEILSEMKEILSDYPYEIETFSKSGSPYLEIIDLADKEDVDLIIMGNRGLGVFSRTLLGSVSNKVLNHSKKSVLIVKDELED
ncbi:universal stress protein [Anaerosphaera multitolerans]|uniref:Universal stress protein n=1 Tax=Anaerosphaera multitolerans TaxID=2487351 RepID=A0A437S475_9FIRM|nr:universal stress protein [Anaerosphaera multitolerans]RVU53809.1 universal stress protein [Anaerosphaera multitolerans]